ncbi:MAG: MBL fold metallo-hydrolase [Chloroflexi bacterium]|uniref:rhodanese-like domain-containing protein n=1 Tax=Candidatus Flexifilum breve TaxID=3140694 RepID=UPI0031374AA6|nr:MBL fold metallo-hydrolase [Chloroflexota bacterium]
MVADKTRTETAWMALTGDTLFVGDAGRPDLVGLEAARDLAGHMHDTLNNEYLTLPDGTLILPGHGAGSLCGKSIGSVRMTTLGFERGSNPALQPRTRDEYIDFAVSGLPEQPGNHKRIKAINRRGPRPLGVIKPRPLSTQQAINEFQRGRPWLDTRTKAEYKQSHIPGATHLPFDEQLSNRVGHVLHPDALIVIQLSDPADYERLVYSLARVGFENVVGYLADSLATWEALGLPVTAGDVRDIEPGELRDLLARESERPLVVDVREAWEYASGHVPGAKLISLGELGRRVSELDPHQPVAVICASGSCSQSAAALLGQKGFETVYNILGGMYSWAGSGLPVERN